MDYKLAGKLLLKYKDDDIRQLVQKYTEAMVSIHSYQILADEQSQQIKILKAENKFLKEDLDAI